MSKKCGSFVIFFAISKIERIYDGGSTVIKRRKRIVLLFYRKLIWITRVCGASIFR